MIMKNIMKTYINNNLLKHAVNTCHINVVQDETTHLSIFDMLT